MNETITDLMAPPDSIMAKLERQGHYTQDSVLSRTGYVVVKDKVVILKGAFGAAALCNVGELRKLAAELNDMAEVLEYRKFVGVKGA